MTSSDDSDTDEAVEVARMEATLRERFGDEHELLRPGVFRGTLWLQAAAWAIHYDERRDS